MPNVLALKDEAPTALSAYMVANVVVACPSFLQVVEKSLADMEAGRLTPWEALERELGLG